jgi:hypothetical protein
MARGVSVHGSNQQSHKEILFGPAAAKAAAGIVCDLTTSHFH